MCLQGFSIAANWEHLDKLQYIKTTCIYKMKQGKSYLQKEWLLKIYLYIYKYQRKTK